MVTTKNYLYIQELWVGGGEHVCVIITSEHFTTEAMYALPNTQQAAAYVACGKIFPLRYSFINTCGPIYMSIGLSTINQAMNEKEKKPKQSEQCFHIRTWSS